MAQTATDITTGKDPFQLFDEWMETAKKSEPDDATAMALATADASGFPDVRMVLLKEAGPDGFVFYTNLESIKGQELAENPQAALCFHWKSLKRQIRIRGDITPVSDAEADAYFATRAKDSQIGAWASKQSRPMKGRFELEKEVARFAAKYALKKVDRPPFWSGFRLTPRHIEFWRDRPFRLHDRLVFSRDTAKSAWQTERVFP
ncbi:MAG: pyridoxamine 5'-phosphate oxidase [Rhodobiaceae bacterium]|nr:MAG: pyridoxamine 5'-phosphate oxidase [Rhodobiaceae bacterium]